MLMIRKTNILFKVTNQFIRIMWKYVAVLLCSMTYFEFLTEVPNYEAN